MSSDSLVALEVAFARISAGPKVDQQKVRRIIDECLAILMDPATTPIEGARAADLNRRAFQLYMAHGRPVLN